MYVVTVFFEVKPERIESFSQAVLHNARTSLADEPGCQLFDVSIDPDDGMNFFLYEVYDDEAAFDAHKETKHFKDFSTLTDPWVTHKRVLTYERLNGPGQA